MSEPSILSIEDCSYPVTSLTFATLETLIIWKKNRPKKLAKLMTQTGGGMYINQHTFLFLPFFQSTI